MNNLKIAFRHLRHSRIAAAINIFGLALSLAAAFFIWQYVQMEHSYDQFHTRADRIYRMTLKLYEQGKPAGHDAMNVAPAGPALAAAIPEIESYVRFTPEYGRTVFQYGDRQYEEEKLFYADSTLFEVFDFPLLEGNPRTCLIRPFTALLTRTVAERYFGPRESWAESPLGRTLRINGRGNLEVTGILEDVPENSHIDFDVLVSFNTFPMTNADPSREWGWNDFFTYVLLREGADIASLESKLADFNQRHFQDKEPGFYKETEAQPLTDIHLHSDLGYEAEPNGDAQTVYFLLLIGLAIVLVAWINYINLSTARAEDRAREVGIRKVIGAGRGKLIGQFLTEALVVNLLAVLLAAIIVQAAQPAMNALVGKILPPFFSTSLSWLLLVSLPLVGTLLAGFYPAVFLSSFSPATALKGEKQRRGKGVLRKSLVTFQYVVSTVLIIGTIVIFMQLRYMKQQDLGFTLDQQLIVNAPTVLDSASLYAARYASFREALLQFPEISQVGASSAVPGKRYLDMDDHGDIHLQGNSASNSTSFKNFAMDEGFLDVFGLQLLAGRNFSQELISDDEALLINESALQTFGLDSPASAIGQIVNYQGQYRPILGVVADYHHRSLRYAHEPMIFRNTDHDFLYFSLGLQSVRTTEMASVIEKVQQTWDRFFPDNPFNYFFLDAHFNEQYLAEQRLGNIIALFSLLAIFIACLGLFGLASYMVTIRTKEIGIRKILGASTTSLVNLLSRDFMALVLLALLIATPLAWITMNGWLENFAYRITMEWWIFLLAGIAAMSIAFLTVSLQSVKAAIANPVDSLKNE